MFAREKTGKITLIVYFVVSVCRLFKDEFPHLFLELLEKTSVS